jgi:RHS repeat-associated protein
MSDFHKTSSRLLGTLAALTLLGANALAQTMPAPDFTPETRTSKFDYDDATGLLIEEQIEPNRPELCVKTRYQLDLNGNRKQTTTSNCADAPVGTVFADRTANASYSNAVQPNGTLDGSFVTSAWNALNHTETKLVDPGFGQATSVTGPNGLTTTWELDALGRKVKETRADGSFSRMWYCYVQFVASHSSNSPGCPGTIGTPMPNQPATDPKPLLAMSFVHTQSYGANGVVSGPWTRAYQDMRGRTMRSVTQAFDGDSGTAGKLVVADTFYNQNGAAVLTTQPYFLHSLSSGIDGSGYGFTYTQFDVIGRPLAVYTADNGDGSEPITDAKAVTELTAFGHAPGALKFSVVRYAYEGAKTKVTRRSRDGEQVDIQWRDPLGHVVLAEDAAHAQTAFLYDAQGGLLTTVDPLGNRVEVRYDGRGRKTAMLDPNKGYWTYGYNALGELTSQQSPNQRAAGTCSTLAYDVLGRLVEKLTPEFKTSYLYDTTTGAANGAACLTAGTGGANATKGKLCGSSTTHGVARSTVYDRYLRPVNSTTALSGDPRYQQKTFSQSVEYDANFGRPVKQTWQTGVSVQYGYTGLGAMQTVHNGSGYVYWTAQRVNAWGKVEDALLGHGVSSHTRFDPMSGRVIDAAAGTGNDITNAAAMNVFKHHYVWDALGNLSTRTDVNGAGSGSDAGETFVYDELNRLTHYETTNPGGQTQNVTLAYNAIGNILSKSDVGSYVYPASGQPLPHAVSAIRARAGGPVYNADYEYDAQGNLTRAFGDARYRTIRYNSFNLPQGDGVTPGIVGVSSSGVAPSYDWMYGEAEQRLVEVRKTSRGTRTTWSLHPDGAGGLSYEQETDEAGVTTHRHYIAVGSATALVTTTAAAPATVNKLEYWHKDHLGSTVAVTVAGGSDWRSVVKTIRYAYDPWGKRRYANGAIDPANALIGDYHGGAPDAANGTDRGFTGHEHLDDLGVIHMNARLYDPLIGRFMQGDPVVGDPFDIQTYNAYSYVYNRPLNTVDADGKCPVCAAFIIGALVARAAGIIDQQQMRMVISIAVAAWIGPMGAQTGWLGAGHAAATGFVSGAIASGDLKGGVQGAFSGAVFFGIGQAATQLAGAENMKNGTGAWSNNGLGRAAMHAAGGCVTSVAGGGNCGTGAMTAGVGKALGGALNGTTNGPLGTFTAAMIGGTLSVVGGGKFASGAQTGAFQYLFNKCASRPGSCEFGEWQRAIEERWRAATVPLNNTDGCVGSNASNCAGISESKPALAPYVQDADRARLEVSQSMDKASKVFIYGAGAVAFLPPPWDIPAVPLGAIGLGLDLTADLMDPKPLKMGTDWAVDKTASRVMRVSGPAGAAANAATQAVKDLKNATPLGDY